MLAEIISHHATKIAPAGGRIMRCIRRHLDFARTIMIALAGICQNPRDPLVMACFVGGWGTCFGGADDGKNLR